MSEKTPNPIFSVGHSNHEIGVFLRLLIMHAITAVADVRSKPYSRIHAQFNREALRDALRERGIAYVFLGRELGARSEDPSCYIDGVVQYDRLAQTALFQEGIGRVVAGSANHRIALLCAERDPLTCHRTILVGKELVARGAQLNHIRETGLLESHEDAMVRLLAETGIQSTDLFRSRAEIESDAYARRASEIAYRPNRLPTTLAAERK